MAKKTTTENFYQQLGPLTLFDHFASLELEKLNKLRDSMCFHGVKYVNGVDVIDKQIRALEEQKSAILRWMEKAIKVVPWRGK